MTAPESAAFATVHLPRDALRKTGDGQYVEPRPVINRNREPSFGTPRRFPTTTKRQKAIAARTTALMDQILPTMISKAVTGMKHVAVSFLPLKGARIYLWAGSHVSGAAPFRQAKTL